jgi:hypothetical protein
LPAFILFFDFYFEKKKEILGKTQNWVMTVSPLSVVKKKKNER